MVFFVIGKRHLIQVGGKACFGVLNVQSIYLEIDLSVYGIGLREKCKICHMIGICIVSCNTMHSFN